MTGWVWAATAAWATSPATSGAHGPQVTVSWRGDRSVIHVSPADGTELAPDAPATLELAWADGRRRDELPGLALAAWPTADLRGERVQGQLDVSICAKADGTCAMTSWAIAGDVPDTKKGSATLALTAPWTGVTAAAPASFNVPADAAVEGAFAEAKASGDLVLLDFSAVWCPPCNLLAAEVLHADDADDALAGFSVAVLDVDHASSFAWKARYDVRGYPTVVVADADGRERARLVGYPGREAFLDWLAKAGSRDDAAALAAGPDAATPELALELAWSLLQDRRFDDAKPWVARGAGVDSALARRVRVAIAPTADDVQWLLANDLDAIYDWMGAAMELKGDHPELARRVAEAAVARLDGPALADAFFIFGEVTGETWAYGAAASALRTAMSGDPEADRGHITWLADLTARSDLPAALALLDEARARWPDEPTWDLTAANLLSSAGQHADALAAGRRAWEEAWGDNALRAAKAVAEAHLALGDQASARDALERALAEPAPDAALAVRTHRYRAQLQELLARCD